MFVFVCWRVRVQTHPFHKKKRESRNGCENIFILLFEDVLCPELIQINVH